MPLTWNETRNQWEGDPTSAADAHLVVSRYSELPNPSTVAIGTVAVVHNDPDDRLNGLHTAHGKNWRKA